MDDAAKTWRKPVARDGLIGEPEPRPGSLRSGLKGVCVSPLQPHVRLCEVEPQVAQVVDQAVQGLVAKLGARVEQFDPGFSDPLRCSAPMGCRRSTPDRHDDASAKATARLPGCCALHSVANVLSLDDFNASPGSRAAWSHGWPRSLSLHDVLVSPMIPITRSMRALRTTGLRMILSGCNGRRSHTTPSSSTKQRRVSALWVGGEWALRWLAVVGARLPMEQVLRVCQRVCNRHSPTETLAHTEKPDLTYDSTVGAGLPALAQVQSAHWL